MQVFSARVYGMLLFVAPDASIYALQSNFCFLNCLLCLPQNV